MRILVGHTNQMAEIRGRLPLPGRRSDEIIAFGNGYTQIEVRPEMSWAEILERCPAGWHPEIYIHWSPEYNPVPQGLEEAECLTVGVFGDWNLGGRAMRAIGGMFDILVADRGGCERLRNMGFQNVLHSLLWAYDPQKHRRLEGQRAPERDIDVLMIGNFNVSVQWERAPWLARVARLSRRHRVVLTSGLFDEAYLRTMNQAKIVFNRSIRGEANMRAYEAAACGALLFYEAGNREIQEIYEDRESCVLYDETNLESLLAFYLDPQNSAERLRIAENGWQRVQQHSYAHHFADLLNHIEQLLPTCIGTRPLCLTNPVERDIAVANHWLMSCNTQILPQIDLLLQQISKNSSKAENTSNTTNALQKAQVALLQGANWGEIASGARQVTARQQALQAAFDYTRRALKLTPQSMMAKCNLAYLTLAMGDKVEAEAQLNALAQTLDCWPSTEPLESAISTSTMDSILDSTLNSEQCTDIWCLDGPLFPRRFEWLDVAIEGVYGEQAPGSAEWQRRMHALLTARVYLTLGELGYASQRYLLSVQCAQRAVQAMPTLGEAHYAHAVALRALGRIDSAIDAYQQTLRYAAFHMTAYEELARLYLDVGRIAEAQTHLDNWIAFLEGCPFYGHLRPAAEHLRRQVQQRAVTEQTIGTSSKTAGSIYRLLALPDWNRAEEWQPLVRAFALRYRPSEPVVLMLRADPNKHPDARLLLARLERFLRVQVGCTDEPLPNITLLNQVLGPTECWKLLHIADALLTTAPLSPFWCDLAQANSVPILSEVDAFSTERELAA